MNTKEKIIATSLALFNEQGIDSITIRHIAKEMGISHGNIQYYYKNNNEIILALYQQLAAHFNAMINAMEPGNKIEMATFRTSVKYSFRLMYEYRFLLLHFVEVVRRVPEVREHYRELSRQREVQFQLIFKQFVGQKLFRADIPEEIWASLSKQLFIMADGWLSTNAITGNLKGEEAIALYERVFWHQFFPLLTAKGIRQYQACS